MSTKCPPRGLELKTRAQGVQDVLMALAPLPLQHSNRPQQLNFSIANFSSISWATSSSPGFSTADSRRYESPIAHHASDAADAYRCNPPFISGARSSSVISTRELFNYDSPLIHHAFDNDDTCMCDPRLVEDVAGNDIIRQDTHTYSPGNVAMCVSADTCISNSFGDINHGASRAIIDTSSKNASNMFNLHGFDDGNEPKQQKCSRLSSHLYPYGQSSCQESRRLQTLCNNGHLDQAMEVLSHLDTSPSTDAYLSLLSLSHQTKSFTYLKDVCSHLVRHRAELKGYLGDFLVTTLAKSGAVENAQEIANRLAHRTVFSWTAIISAYVHRGEDLKALKLYECMRKDGVEPDAFTFASLFKACASIQDLALGKLIHMDACKKGLETEILVGNSLLSMYGKCGAIFEAENAFMTLSYRDIVSWTAMLSAYLEQGLSKEALQIFRQMQEEYVDPNSLTCVIALQACVNFVETAKALEFEGKSVKEVCLEIGQAIHAYACRKGFESDAYVGTTLLNMYGKCGSIRMVGDALSMLSSRSTVSWNAMLSAYVDQNCGKEALLLFRQMLQESVPPDALTYVFTMQACVIAAEKEADIIMQGCSMKVVSLKIGHALHADVCMNGYRSDILVATALVDMYGKCGSIEEAEAVFEDFSNHDLVLWMAMFTAYLEHGQGEKALRLHKEMQKQQLFLDHAALTVSWTALLSAFVAQGQGERALELYRQMQEEGVMLDDVALNCTLQVCCLTGSLELCKEIHFCIVCKGYDSMPSSSATLIHAYASCGSMIDAQVIFSKLSEPDMDAWRACIVGYAIEGNATSCISMFEKLIQEKITPDTICCSSVLSVCCHAGYVARGLEFFDVMIKVFEVAPNLKHYGIVIDLLGRAGNFTHIVELLESMPLQPDLTIWMCLLGACQTHGNVELAKLAFNYAVSLQPNEGAIYTLTSNMYAEAGV